MKMKMMKKKLLFLILLIVSVTGRAQNLCGTFTGKLEVGAMKLTIVLNINADGSATLESPDQTNQKIPATTDFLSADSVAVSVAMLRASYKGRLVGDELQGTFAQAGMSLPLTLKQGAMRLEHRHCASHGQRQRTAGP